MQDNRVLRTLEMIQYYSDTFARLPFVASPDVGRFGTTIISSVLNCQVSVLFFQGSSISHEFFANAGLDEKSAAQWQKKDKLIQHILTSIHVPTIIHSENLDSELSDSIQRLGLNGVFLIVPLKGLKEHRESVSGFVVASHLQHFDNLELDLITLDIVANLVMGGVANCIMRNDLLTVNKSLEAENKVRQRAEAELELVQDDLEQRVLDRTAELAQQVAENKRTQIELKRVFEAAEAATQAKSDFLANMSHEIRTPMTAILGFAENLMGRDQSEEEINDSVQTIRRNGEFLLEIINDILDLSKIEANKMTVERIACDPCQIMAEVASLMRVRADLKNLPLTIDYDGGIPETIQSDPTRLRQILINMVGNAIKFTIDGSIRVVIRLVKNADVSLLQFDVMDTGKGMTQQQRTELFQPFTQADSTLTREFGGTGLGLTISRRLAHLLGGDMCVIESEIDMGTTFRATISTGSLEGVKIIENPQSEILSKEIVKDKVVGELVSLQGCRILLAEDGADNRQLITYILTKAGAVVQTEVNGKLAVDTAMKEFKKETPYDIILMDMQMPVMDGYQAAKRLRQQDYERPIIALTANAMEGDRQKCIDAGCNHYLVKPIDRTKLIQTVRQYWSGSLVASTCGS